MRMLVQGHPTPNQPNIQLGKWGVYMKEYDEAPFARLVAEQYQQEPEKVTAIVGFGNMAAIVIVPIMLHFVLPAV